MVIIGIPGEVDGAEELPTAVAAAIAVTIAETSRLQNIPSKKKMKDGPISKLTITKTGHRPSQFKKIRNALPVFCADNNYGGLDEVLRTGRDQVKNDFISAYSDVNQWSTTHHIQVATVNPTGTTGIDETTRERPVRYQTVEQTIVINANLQK